MKKSIFTMGVVLAVSALALTNCAKDELAAPSGKSAAVNGKLAAAIIDTKTAADGLKTLWAAGDAATVFHGEAGATTIVKDGKWTADAAGATTNFTGNISTDLTPAAGTLYNWYMCYPHKANLTSPTGTGAVFTVGAQIQKQAEFDSRAHMCGDNVPLAGRALNVDGADVPEISMNNLCTAIEFNITNKTSEWLRLHAVDFIGPDGEIIAGNFNVDFTGDVPAYTADPANKIGNVSVRIGGGAVVLPDASAKVYAAVKPFTAPAGSTLKVRVNGYEKTLAVTEPIEFAPGHIRTFNVAYDEPAVDYSGEYFIGCKGGDGRMYIAVGQALAPADYDGSTGANHILISKGCRLDGNVLYYDPDMNITGVNATLAAAIDDYKFTITKVTDDPLYKGMYLIKGIDGKVMYTSDAANSNSVDFSDLESLKSQGLESNAYFNISSDVNGAMYIVATSASMTKRRFAFNYNNGNIPRFTCFDEGTTNVNAMLIPTAGCAVDPLPRFAPIADISCPASGASGEIFNVVVENNDAGWAVSATPDGTVVTDASAWDIEISYSAVANTDTLEAKTGYIVLSLTDPNAVLPDVVDTVFVKVSKCPTKFYRQVTSLPDFTGLTKSTTPYEYLLVCKDLNIAFKSAAQNGGLTQPGNFINVSFQDDGSIIPTDLTDANTIKIADNFDPSAAPENITIWCHGLATGSGYWWQSIGIKAAAATASMNYNTDDRFMNVGSIDGDGNFVATCKGTKFTGTLGVNANWKEAGYEFRYNSASDLTTYECYPVQLFQLMK